ncbi:MAG: hypothetical protein K1X53_11425 [Candidatus Sumerlaeaceae bacterium]|nr:hypothetical protein [Candidatus Sumerlaeaceae bacterium]
MKRILIALSFAAISAVGFAQNIDGTTVTDQFNVTGLAASRGNAAGTGGAFGASKRDGTESAIYGGVDSVGGLNYINTYAGASSGDAANGETPVYDITTTSSQADRALLDVPGHAANTRPGATGPNTAVSISDDGGQNSLFFGQTTSKNYYISADVYCFDNSVVTTSGFECAYVAARAARDNDPGELSGAYSIDRAGSYVIMWDYQLKVAKAMKITSGTTTANIQNHLWDSTVGTTYFSSAITANAWHTFRIDCTNSNIKFSIDGSVVANVSDSTWTEGRPGLGYREASVASAAELTAHFDNLIAGPTTIAPAAANDWALYQ